MNNLVETKLKVYAAKTINVEQYDKFAAWLNGLKSKELKNMLLNFLLILRWLDGAAMVGPNNKSIFWDTNTISEFIDMCKQLRKIIGPATVKNVYRVTILKSYDNSTTVNYKHPMPIMSWSYSKEFTYSYAQDFYLGDESVREKALKMGLVILKLKPSSEQILLTCYDIPVLTELYSKYITSHKITNMQLGEKATAADVLDELESADDMLQQKEIILELNKSIKVDVIDHTIKTKTGLKWKSGRTAG